MNIKLVLSSLAITTSVEAFSGNKQNSINRSYKHTDENDIISQSLLRNLEEKNNNVVDPKDNSNDISKLQQKINELNSEVKKYKAQNLGLSAQVDKFRNIIDDKNKIIQEDKRKIEELEQRTRDENDLFINRLRNGFREAYREYSILFSVDILLFIFIISLLLWKKLCLNRSSDSYDDLSISDRPIIPKNNPSIINSRSIEKDLTSIASESRSKSIKTGKSSSGVNIETSDVKIETNNNGSKNTLEKVTEVVSDTKSKPVFAKQKMPVPIADSTVPPTVSASAQMQNL